MSYFITIEGTDGAGKSTQLNWVADMLTDKNIEFVVTREPGGTVLGESLRELILSREKVSITPLSQLLLMFAARAQHIEEVIQPALDSGKWVVCDRFTDASYAYQGAAGGLGMDVVSAIESLVHGELQPDLTILLDVSVEIGEARIAKRSESSDRFEKLETEKKKKIRKTYLDRCLLYPDRIKRIDASKDISGVKTQIEQILEPLLP